MRPEELSTDDVVQARAGLPCPDDPAIDIGSWRGRVTDVNRSESDSPCLDVAWDSHTLRAMPPAFIAQSVDQGLDWTEMSLDARDIEPAEARDTPEEVARVVAALEDEHLWYAVRGAAVRALTPDRVYQRGLSYFHSGAVSQLTASDGGFQASVQGGRRYRVEVRGSTDAPDLSCTCPYDRDECKHVIAVLLTIRDVGRAMTAPGWAADAALTGEGAVAPPDFDPQAALAAMSADQLRDFLARALREDPALRAALWVAAQGGEASPRTVEGWAREILVALESADLDGDEWIGERWRERYDDFEDEEPEDTVEGVLEPFRDAARRLREQGNWREAAKLQEATFRACVAFHRDQEHVYALRAAVSEALSRWVECLAEAPPGEARREALSRLSALFWEEHRMVGPAPWEQALQSAVATDEDIGVFLAPLPPAEGGEIAASSRRAPALLTLLDKAGDVERYLALARSVTRYAPSLAERVARRLLALGRRQDALALAEESLARSHEHQRAPRRALRRWLVSVYDPEQDRTRRLQLAREIFFEEGELDSWRFLRALVATGPPREALLQEATRRCAHPTVVAILVEEGRWSALLDYVRGAPVRQEPGALRQLAPHAPAAVFGLGRDRLLAALAEGTGRALYQRAARYAAVLSGIPGQEKSFSALILQIERTYRRRSSLLRELAPYLEAAHAWQERNRPVPSDPGTADLDTLIAACPLSRRHRAQVVGARATWSAPYARLVWALLARWGGRVEAARLTEGIARHRGVRRESAMAARSQGLRVLEVLGWVEVERVDGRLGEARLLEWGDLTPPADRGAP